MLTDFSELVWIIASEQVVVGARLQTRKHGVRLLHIPELLGVGLRATNNVRVILLDLRAERFFDLLRSCVAP